MEYCTIAVNCHEHYLATFMHSYGFNLTTGPKWERGEIIMRHHHHLFQSIFNM